MKHFLVPLLLLATSAPALLAQAGPNQWSEPAGLPRMFGIGSQLVETAPDTFYFLADMNGNPPELWKFSGGIWSQVQTTVPTGRADAYSSMAHLPGTPHLYYSSGMVYDRSFWRFDMTTLQWDPMTDHPYSMGIFTGLVAASGKLYATTGFYPGRFEEFDPAQGPTGTWRRLAQPPQFPRGGATLAHIPGTNHIYALRGYKEDDSEAEKELRRDFYRYSIATVGGENADTWTVLQQLPAIATERTALFGRSGPDAIYCMTTSVTDQLYRYTPSRPEGERWENTAVPGQCVIRSGMAGLTGDSVFIARGGTTDFWTYSISLDTFGSFPLFPDAAVDRGGCMTGVGNGSDLYALAGNFSAKFARYSATRNAWTPLPPAPDPVQLGASLVHAGGILYATQGIPISGPGQTFWSYSILSNEWTTLSPIPGGTGVGSRLVAGDADHLYLTIGYVPGNGSGGHKSFYRYSISGNQWLRMADAPGDMSDGSISVYPGYGDHLFISRAFDTGQFWSYCISRNEWNVAADGRPFDPADLPFAVNGAACATLIPGSEEIHALFQVSYGVWQLWIYRLPTSADPSGIWTMRAGVPGTLSSGAAIAHPGSGPHLYALPANKTSQIWRYWMENESPSDPSALAQFRLNGSTPIAEGGHCAHTGFVIKGDVRDIDGDPTRIVAEIRPVGVDFTGLDADQVVGGWAPSRTTASLTFPPGTLTQGVSYHWRARIEDGAETRSNPVSFGGNGDPDGIDLFCRENNAPTVLETNQLRGDLHVPLEIGKGVDAGTAIEFTASCHDSDGDPFRFEVELRPADGAFTGIPTLAAPMTPGGSRVLVSTPGVGEYDWACRAVDDWDGVGDWIRLPRRDAPFTFAIFSIGSISDGSGCGAGGADSATALPAAIVIGSLLFLARRLGILLILPLLMAASGARAGDEATYTLIAEYSNEDGSLCVEEIRDALLRLDGVRSVTIMPDAMAAFALEILETRRVLPFQLRRAAPDAYEGARVEACGTITRKGELWFLSARGSGFSYGILPNGALKSLGVGGITQVRISGALLEEEETGRFRKGTPLIDVSGAGPVDGDRDWRP